MSDNFNFRKKVIEITLKFTQNQNNLCQSFLLVSNAIVHADDSNELRKTIINFESMLKKHNQSINTYFSGMLLIRQVSELEMFLVEIIKELITVYPQKVGKQQFPLSDIFSATKEELIIVAAEKYINEIMYKKPKEYLDEICKLLSIKSEPIENDWRFFIEAKARRDLGIHNDWKLNKTYERKIQEVGIAEIPERIVPDFHYIISLVEICGRIMENIKDQIIKKYS